MVKGGATYMDSIVRWCGDRGLEIEVGAELVDQFPLVKSRLQMEAEGLNLMKDKPGRLPL
jgi:hypothetical protein